MTPQELVMAVQQIAGQMDGVQHRLGLTERELRRVAKKVGSAVPVCPPAPRSRPSRHELRIVDAALAQVAREAGIVVLEILNGGRGADWVAARRKVALLASLEGLSDSAIARAMGCDRGAIRHRLRKVEGGE